MLREVVDGFWYRQLIAKQYIDPFCAFKHMKTYVNNDTQGIR